MHKLENPPPARKRLRCALLNRLSAALIAKGGARDEQAPPPQISRPAYQDWRALHRASRRDAQISRPTLSYVYDGQQCLGHILARGRSGLEAFDREERSLGLFKTAPAAANAVFNAAAAEGATG
jgi:hypothetical protein